MSNRELAELIEKALREWFKNLGMEVTIIATEDEILFSYISPNGKKVIREIRIER